MQMNHLILPISFLIIWFLLCNLTSLWCISKWYKIIPRTFGIEVLSFSRKLSLGALSRAPWLCHWYGTKGVYKVGEGRTMFRHWLHICLEGSGSSHPEQWNSKLIELRRHAAAVNGAFVTELKTRDDIVIREENSERCMGPQAHI